MIGALLAAVLSAGAPPGGAGSTPPAAPPADPPESASETLSGLLGVYDQSCANRAYGSFDDVCDQISRQIDAYRKKAAQEERAGRRRPGPAKPPGAAADRPAGAVSALPSAAP